MKPTSTMAHPRRQMLDSTWAITQRQANDCGPAVVARLLRATQLGHGRTLQQRLIARIRELKWRAKYFTSAGDKPFVTSPGQLRSILNSYGLNYTVTPSYNKGVVQAKVAEMLGAGHTVAVLINEGQHWALLHGWQDGIVGVVNPGNDISYPYAFSYDALWSDDSMLGKSVPEARRGYSFDGDWVAVVPDIDTTPTTAVVGQNWLDRLSMLDDSWRGCDAGPADYYFETDGQRSPTRHLVPWKLGNTVGALFGFDGEGHFRLAALGHGVDIAALTPTTQGLLAPDGRPDPNDWEWLGFERVMSLGRFKDCVKKDGLPHPLAAHLKKF